MSVLFEAWAKEAILNLQRRVVELEEQVAELMSHETQPPPSPQESDPLHR